MDIKFRKGIYTANQILKAAYVFTDQAYILLDDDAEYIYVHLEAKDGYDISSIQGELKNEVLAQIVRESINMKTRNIRELIYQRAMSSSIIVPDNYYSELDRETPVDFELTPILKDWFDGSDH